MSNYFMVIGCILAQTISFCASYKIIFSKDCTRDKKRFVLFIFLMALIHSLMFYKYDWKITYDFSFLSQFLIPIMLIHERGIEKYVQMVFISVATPLLGVLPLNIIALIQKKSISYYFNSVKWMLLIEVTIMIFMITLYIVTRADLELYSTKISLQGYVAIISVVISSLLFIGCVQEIAYQYENDLLNIIGVASSIACIIPDVVVIWLLRTEQKRNELEIQNRISSELILMQKNYNESIVDNNEQLRRFRHDFKGHIQVLQQYCRENEIDKMKSYLNTMVEESMINNGYKYTGNVEIDAIIRPLAKRCEEQNIKLEINGFLPHDITKLDIYDMCSIFYNLVNNAVEECERILGKAPWIRLDVANYNDCLRIFIENSAEKQKDINEIYTQKEDSKNHGIGLRTVKRVVERYDGTINITSTSDVYIVEIIF